MVVTGPSSVKVVSGPPTLVTKVSVRPSTRGPLSYLLRYPEVSPTVTRGPWVVVRPSSTTGGSWSSEGLDTGESGTVRVGLGGLEVTVVLLVGPLPIFGLGSSTNYGVIPEDATG